MYKELMYEHGQANTASIANAEKRVGHKFQNSFNEFCKKFDGAKFKCARILISDEYGNDIGFGIRQFINTAELGISNVERWDNNLVAFAEDLGGNYFVFKKPVMDNVYFWDHETDSLTLASPNFQKFLDSIEGYDVNDVDVPTDAQTWIDPDFLQELKDKGAL